MFAGLLPIGSVVVVGNSKKKVMIVGVCQKSGSDGKIWDYTGVVFPEGYIDAKKMFLFNNDQITKVMALGYQDEEQLEFKKKVDNVMKTLKRNEEA